MNPHTIKNIIEYSFKNFLVRAAMFTVIIFKILLFKDRSKLSSAQWAGGNKRVKVLVKNEKNIRILLKLFEKWLNYKFRRFWMIFTFFFFFFFFELFNPFITGKIEKIDFWDANSSTVLHINKSRTTCISLSTCIPLESLSNIL